jgi:hypothetical protein
LVSVLPLIAVLVIFLPLLGVGENLMGLIDLLELGLSCFIPRVYIGMMFSSQLTISLLYFLGGGCLDQAENVIVILPRHIGNLLQHIIALDNYFVNYKPLESSIYS